MSERISTSSPKAGSISDESIFAFDGAEALLRAWGGGLKPDPLLTVSEWADRYRNLRKTSTHIEYQHVGDADWTELVTLTELIGPAGAAGSAGAAGAAGTNGTTLAGVNPQSGTSYTPVLADAAKIVECANAAAITLTVPPNGSVAFPINTVIYVAQAAAGQVTIAAGSGVTIKKHAAFNARTLGPEAVVSLAKTGTDSWRLFGLLEAA